MEERGKKKEGKKGRKKIDARRKQVSFCHFAILVFLSPISASISKRAKTAVKAKIWSKYRKKQAHSGAVRGKNAPTRDAV